MKPMVRLNDYSHIQLSDIDIKKDGSIEVLIFLSDDWWCWEKFENLQPNLQRKITCLLRKEKIEKIMKKIDEE
ncbi:hypothetical protein [Carboxylicivirga sp. RSCT41]|uniref:hypothetical protein n=1 Tax=Carboxylicivirga agarovorans TaxID=3417570 RepID=UPI003D331CC3